MNPSGAASFVVPAWGRGTLADVLPAVLAGMGAVAAAATPESDLANGLPPGSALPPGATASHAIVPSSSITLPPARRVCVFLIDGLGLDLLIGADPRSAPFLRSLLPTSIELDAGFPSSTPVSLSSLATGRPPGDHGIVGFTMRVPPVPDVLECLAWTRYGTNESLLDQLPPEVLQPHEPLFAAAAAQGIAASVVSLAEHVASGLSRAAFRGADFDPIAGFDDLDGRAARVTDRLRRSGRTLVYTYDARLDTEAHRHGVASDEWRDALREVDRVAARLARALPRDGLLLVTGDHGAIDLSAAARIDLADRDDLSDGVAALSGDPRARHVHAQPGREAEVLDAWRHGLDGGWIVLGRDEAIDAGLFGPRVDDVVRLRVGDVVAIAGHAAGIFDRRRFPWELRLVGFHGGLDRAELKVPLLIAQG